MDGPRKILAWPWGYAESSLILAALTLGGFLAQWRFGPVDPLAFAWPANLGVLGVLFLLAVLARIWSKTRPVLFLSGLPFSVSLIGLMALYGLAMGLIPQSPPPPALFHQSLLSDSGIHPLRRLGLRSLTSSWPFAAAYLTLLASLGVSWAVRLSLKRPVFFLNHMGLWFLLAAAGLGAADREREIMRVPEGAVEWRVRSGPGQTIKEMPLAIRLDRFTMDEYPARLAIIDGQSGQPLPLGQPAFLQLEKGMAPSRLLDFDISLSEFLPKAAPSGQRRFSRSILKASVQAANLTAKDILGGQTYQGWVSTGNSYLPVMPLKLSRNLFLVMTRPEPRRFMSQVKVFTKSGQEIEGQVEVNRPLRVGPWLVYQRDYDSEAGPMSQWSGFELIKDPWLGLAYLGLALWAAGCLGLMCKKPKRKGGPS